MIYISKSFCFQVFLYFALYITDCKGSLVEEEGIPGSGKGCSCFQSFDDIFATGDLLTFTHYYQLLFFIELLNHLDCLFVIICKVILLQNEAVDLVLAAELHEILDKVFSVIQLDRGCL